MAAICLNQAAGGYGDSAIAAFWFCVKVSSIALCLLAATGFVFARPLVQLFRADDPLLTDIAASAIRYQSVVFPLLGWIIIVNMFLQNTRKTVRASVLAMARQGIAFIPVLLLFSGLWGLTGIKLAQPAADTLTFFLALPFGLSTLREMKEETESI